MSLIHPTPQGSPFGWPSVQWRAHALSVCLGFVAVLGLGQPAVEAQQGPERPKAMIVFDGSGSMWGSLELSSKVNVARRALLDRIPSSSRQVDLGLIAYGHRRRSDCGDVELLQPPVRGGADALRELLAGISPRGKTPMTSALQLAVDALVGGNDNADGTGNDAGSGAGSGADATRPVRLEQNAAIILVSDGFENCRRDPCDFARDLRKSQPNITIHVLGIALTPEDYSEISCIPYESRGKLLRADSQAALEAGFDTIIASLTEQIPEVTAVPLPPEPRRSPTFDSPTQLHLSAVLEPNGEPIDGNLVWRVIARDQQTRTRVAAFAASDTDEDSSGAAAARPAVASDAEAQARELADAILYEGAAIAPTINAPPGRYRIELEYGLATAGLDIEVTGERSQDAVVPVEAARLQLAAYANPGSPLLDAVFFTLRGADGTETADIFTMSRESMPTYLLPPGRYQAIAQYGLTKTETTVSLNPGDKRALELFLYVGALIVSTDVDVDAIRQSRRDTGSGTGGGASPDILFIVEEDDPEAVSGRGEIARSAAPKPVFTLPAGVYHLTARRGIATARESVAVQPGKVTRKMLKLGSATLRARARFGGDGTALNSELTYRVYREADSRNASASDGAQPLTPVLTTAQPNPDLELASGRYRIVGILGPANAVATTSVNLNEGDITDVVLDYDAGRMTFELRDGAGNAIPRDVYWRISDGAGKVVWQTGARSPQTYLAPGPYTATATHKSRAVFGAFKVAPGDTGAVVLNWR